MSSSNTTIQIPANCFTDCETPFVECGDLSATVFRYSTGVAAVRLTNDKGNLVLLPFQGQQIWSAEFGGRKLTMKSMFTEPRATTSYLDTYGGFLLHCGATAMGVPTGEDTHPLHGELPNAPYQQACVVTGTDEKGDFIGVGGTYHHTVAFNHNYVAQPLVKLYAGSSIFTVALTISNLKKTEMEWMYLAHINFRPVQDGRLVYSAPCTPEHVRVRRSVPAHVKTKPGFREFLDALGKHPEKHNVLTPDLILDPEIVLYLDYVADTDGWAHTMQLLPDGTADYVRHRPAQLDTGIRWICRTEDQAAMGMILPATAEPEGYHAELEKGNIRVLPAQGSVTLNLEMGVLTAAEATAMAAMIAALL